MGEGSRVIVLNADRIVERGTREGMLARRGVYAAMWDRQHQADEAEEELRRAREREEGEVMVAATHYAREEWERVAASEEGAPVPNPFHGEGVRRRRLK